MCELCVNMCSGRRDGAGGGEGGRRKRRRHPRNMKRLLEKEETVTLWDGGHRSGGRNQRGEV